MRGVVTLAAACSIPIYLDDGTAFPQRELICLSVLWSLSLLFLYKGLLCHLY